jgi:hypothetical protein
MMGSFLKRWSGLQAPAEFRNLLRAECPRRKFFERAEGNAIGLAQGAVDSAGFGHAHLGVVEDQGRNVSWMGIAVPDEPATLGRFIDCGLEHPEVLLGAAEGKLGLDLDTRAMVGFRQGEQLGMSDVELCLVLV